MSKEEYKERKRKKPGQRGLGPILGAFVVIALVVGALAFYETETRGPFSNTVYCGVFEYIIFPAQTFQGSTERAINETMTTTVAYTTTTSITGTVGHSYSNQTFTTFLNTVLTSTETAGVETICKYITNSTSISSTSSSK